MVTLGVRVAIDAVRLVCVWVPTVSHGIGAIVMVCPPSEVVNTVVGWVVIEVSHQWQLAGVRQERQRDKPVHVHLSLTQSIQMACPDDQVARVKSRLLQFPPKTE